MAQEEGKEQEHEKDIIADSENSENYSDSSKTDIFADLHIHSRFSRATSKNIDIQRKF